MFFTAFLWSIDIPLVLSCLAFLALAKACSFILARDYVEMIKDKGKLHIIVEEEWIGDWRLVWLQEVEQGKT